MSQDQETDISVTLQVQAAFDGVIADEESMRAALAQLSRDDALFFCARINAIVSGFSNKLSRIERQRNALALLQLPTEAAKIDAYVARNPTSSTPVLFFSGQLLELARWVAAHCQNYADEPNTFNRAEVRSAFLRAAMIASDLWSSRIFAQRLIEEGDGQLQLRRALGAFRKGSEEANEAPHPGIAVGRGWLLFSKYMRKRYPGFDEEFEAATGLSLEKYYVCALLLMTHTFADDPGNVIFPTRGYRGTSPISQACDAFISLKSQDGAQLAKALKRPSDVTGYKSLRERPILNFSGGRSVILDPALFSDTVTISPLFVLLRIADKSKANEIFGNSGWLLRTTG